MSVGQESGREGFFLGGEGVTCMILVSFHSHANLRPPSPQKEKYGECNTIISPLSNFPKCQREAD